MGKIFRVIILSSILLLGGLSTAFVYPFGYTTAEASSISYQTTSNVNMRSGAGTKFKKIMTIPKGEVVPFIEKKGNWYKVSYTYKKSGKKVKKTGWLMGNYLNKAGSASIKFTKTSYKTKVNLNLRSGVGSNFKTVMTIPKGKIVTSKQKQGNWYRVTYTYKLKGKNASKSGWVSGGYLKEHYQYIKTDKVYYFTTKKTKLYATPDTKKKAVLTLKKGNGVYSRQKIVNSIGQTWYKVSINGQKMYINSKDVKINTFTSNSHSNYQTIADSYLYKSYGNVYTKLKSIPKGTVISSKKKIGNWYRVTYDGTSGYIHSSKMLKYSIPITGGNLSEEKVAASEPVVPVTEQEIPRGTYLINENLIMREAASESSRILATIPKGKIVVPSHKTSNDWYKTTYSGTTGYVSGVLLQEVKTGDPLSTRDSYQFIDLRTQSPVTAVQINQYIANYVKLTGDKSILTGKGQVFIDAGKKYGVNALYLAAHAIHESKYGTSSIALGKYNLFGFAAYDATPFVGAYRFSDIDSSIDYIAREMKATYLNPLSWKHRGAYLGFSTKTLGNARIDSHSEGMNFYYASDPLWGVKIANHMQRILPYDKTYYSKATVHFTVPSQPGIPNGSDIFPDGIEAVAKASLSLYQSKGSAAAVKTINKDTSFMLLEKHNDFWVKIKLGPDVYWTKSIKFDVYQKYLSVKNLARVVKVSDYLNVRPEPNTNREAIARLYLNQYIQLMLDQDSNVITDPTKKWYKVKLADGKTGWVSAQYIEIELK